MQFGGAPGIGSNETETLLVCFTRMERTCVEFCECATATQDRSPAEHVLLGVRVCEQSTLCWYTRKSTEVFVLFGPEIL